MNEGDDLFDFMVFYELMFPDEPDKTVECSSCGRVVKGDEKVGWTNKEKTIFKCPDCGKKVDVEE